MKNIKKATQTQFEQYNELIRNIRKLVIPKIQQATKEAIAEARLKYPEYDFSSFGLEILGLDITEPMVPADVAELLGLEVTMYEVWD